MNGRTASRAIQSTSPTTTAAPMSTATRGDRGAMRRRPASSISTKGAGGSAADQCAAAAAATRSCPRPAASARGSEGGAASASGSAGSEVGSWGSLRGDGSLRAGSSTCRRLPDVDGPPDRPRSESRQRWRLVVRRSAEAPPLTHREVTDGWDAAVVASGLPVAFTDAKRPRPRLSFGAPLPLGIAADAELIDLVLAERLPAWRVREALIALLPEGWSLVDLYDVWPAGP